MADGGTRTIEAAHLPEDLRGMIMQTFRKREGSYPTLEELEKSYIEWILKETGDNKTEGAKALDIDRYPLGGELRECEMK